MEVTIDENFSGAIASRVGVPLSEWRRDEIGGLSEKFILSRKIIVHNVWKVRLMSKKGLWFKTRAAIRPINWL